MSNPHDYITLKMIPFCKPSISLDVAEQVKNLLETGPWTNSENVEKFEERCAKISKTRYAVATNSCTTGLLLAARHVFAGKKNIGVPDYTWPSTKAAVIHQGFDPVWLDVDPETWVVHNEDLRSKSEANIVMDTFGNVSMATRGEFIVDAAHSFGIPANPFAKASVYSFALAKTFTAVEGGVITTNNPELYDVLKNEVRWAGRMQEANAVIGLAAIKNYKRVIAKKKKINDYYRARLPFTFQKVTATNYQIVNAKCGNKKQRNFIFRELRKKMQTKIRYTLNSNDYLPVSEDLYNTSFYLPCWSGVPYREVTEIAMEAYNKWEKSSS